MISRRILHAGFLALCWTVWGAAGSSLAAQEIDPGAYAYEAPATIGVDELEKGRKGYGLSVFEGSEPQRFDVEVVGIWRNSSPNTDYILAYLSGDIGGRDLRDVGVISGMSGSPVYFDDRLAGAVAFSWSFSRGALAGITPIEGMRRIPGSPHPDPPLAASVGGPPVSLADLGARRIPKDLLRRELERLRPMSGAWGDGAAPSLQWLSSGFGAETRELLGERLAAPMSTVGRTDDVPGELVHGSAVGAMLIDGDLQLAANGTVTDRDGDVILAFGHPFLGLGPVSLPMSEVEIITVVASEFSSFKIANVGPVVGAFEQDRLLGIQGRLGSQAPMIPLSVSILDAAGQTERFDVRVTGMPILTPGMFGTAVLGGLEVTSYTAGLQGLDLDMRLRLRDHGEIHLTQSFDGASATSDMVGFLVGMIGYLSQNELERVEIDRADVAITQLDRPRTLEITGVHAERSVVRPGQTVTLHVDLVPWRGTPTRRSVQVDVPEDAPDGPYYLFVGDGASVDAARLAIEPTDPVELRQALRYLRSLHSRRQLGVLGVFPDKGLAVAGEVMPRLPGSVASLWTAAASGEARPLSLAVARERYETMEDPLSGLVRVDLTVRRREPLTAGVEIDGPDAAETEPATEAESEDGAQGAKEAS